MESEMVITFLAILLLFFTAPAVADRLELDDGRFVDKYGDIHEDKYETADILAPWNDPLKQDDILAPWNDPFIKDDVLAPWK
jgi:hypothetical protein